MNTGISYKYNGPLNYNATINHNFNDKVSASVYASKSIGNPTNLGAQIKYNFNENSCAFGGFNKPMGGTPSFCAGFYSRF